MDDINRCWQESDIRRIVREEIERVVFRTDLKVTGNACNWCDRDYPHLHPGVEFKVGLGCEHDWWTHPHVRDAATKCRKCGVTKPPIWI